ncbi:MAG: hypothetical protein B6241_13820 [Spirochaetaceae bacterium 4572_59]|nr:MAG: hypothetical protein B6241_13820 [Spirochaetaceae bacterium 4572_59]
MEKIRQASENAVVLADEALLLDPDPLYVDFCFKVLSKREKSLHREALKKEKNAEIQRGSATGNGGDSHWEGSSFTSWLMADAGMDCNFKSFRMG